MPFQTIDETKPADTDLKKDFPAVRRADSVIINAWAFPLAVLAAPANLTPATFTYTASFAAVPTANYMIVIETTGFSSPWEVTSKSTTGFTITFSEEIPAGPPTILWRIYQYG